MLWLGFMRLNIMTRFLKYINENETPSLSIEEGIEYIRNNCKWWLSNVHIPVYRGIRTDLGDDKAFILDRLKDRKPVDTSNEVHTAVDDYFIKKFGWAGRSNAVFVTTDYGQAINYGYKYLCFPIGNSKIDVIFSAKVPDLYIYSRNSFLIKQFAKKYKMYNWTDVWAELNPISNNTEMRKAFASFLVNHLKKINAYKNNTNDLNDHSGEVMVNCDKYVLIKESGKINLQRLYKKITKGIK